MTDNQEAQEHFRKLSRGLGFSTPKEMFKQMWLVLLTFAVMFAAWALVHVAVAGYHLSDQQALDALNHHGLSTRTPAIYVPLRLVTYPFVGRPIILLGYVFAMIFPICLSLFRTNWLAIVRHYSLGSLVGGLCYLLASWWNGNPGTLTGPGPAIAAIWSALAVFYLQVEVPNRPTRVKVVILVIFTAIEFPIIWALQPEISQTGPAGNKAYLAALLGAVVAGVGYELIAAWWRRYEEKHGAASGG